VKIQPPWVATPLRSFESPTFVPFLYVTIRNSLVPDSLTQALKQHDSQFHYRCSAPPGDPWFKTIKGTKPVIVSAPHACAHNRDGVLKMPEEFTGAIAFHLAQQCSCYAIASVYKTDEDPNWQTQSDYKTAIRNLVERHNILWLVDLHGMTNRYQMGIAVGTINGRACQAEEVVPSFVDAGFTLTPETPATMDLSTKRDNSISHLPQDSNNWRKLVVDHPKFTGGVTNHTVTRFASEELQLKSVQIEIASVARVVEQKPSDDWPHWYRGQPDAITATVNALRTLISSCSC